MSKLIFIPIGSTEQHGAHLPPDTDYLIAERLVDAIATHFEGIELEGIKIGISPEHEGFPLTKSVTKEEFMTQIEEIFKKHSNKFKFVFINAHGGNIETLNLIQKMYKDDLLVLNTFSLVKEELIKYRSSRLGGICHAGEFETSLMLYLFPDKVRLNELKKEDVKYIPPLDPNYEYGRIKKWKTINFSESGIIGDPFHANSEKGKIWFKSLVENMKISINSFISKVSTIKIY